LIRPGCINQIFTRLGSLSEVFMSIDGYTVEQLSAIAQIHKQQTARTKGRVPSEPEIIEAGNDAIYILEHTQNPATREWLQVHGLIG